MVQILSTIRIETTAQHRHISSMIRFSAILAAIAFAFVMYHFSAWRTQRELATKSTLLQDPVLLHLTKKMAAQLDLPQIKVNIHEISPINGLATPDGQIYVTRGFMEKYRSGAVTANELASVIAHELGHVALGHSRRRMFDFAFTNALRVILIGVLGRFIPVVGIRLANMISGLLTARLSRQDEYEADAYAAALLTKAGIGVQPQIDLFKKLDYLTGAKGQPLAWMMSHPKAAERIAAIEKLDARWGGSIS